ncbi:MAG TPA: hypothetical protein VGP65_09410, partial [Candidatus Angelobacter sp.]|nr:hypothetical protein [Candidatus Angelobacter sp.]
MTRRVTLLLVPLLVLALTTPFLYSQQNEKDEEARDQAQKRAEYFARQRGVAPGKLPSGRRLQAVRQLEGMRAAEQQRRVAPASGIVNQAMVAGAAANPLSTTPWKSIGPSNVTSGGITWSGRVSAMVVDPRNSLVVYAGAADGGVWKTTNGGQAWTSLTDFQPSLSTGSITLDPANPDIVYVGTGEFNAGDGYPGVGILKSTDGGASWTQMQGPFIPKNIGFRMPAIAVSPANSQIVLAAAFGPNLAISGGVFRSTDGGATWTKVLSANLGATTVVFDPHNISVAYAGIVNSDANGAQTIKFVKSTDAGATWSATGLAQAAGTRVIATVAPTDSSVYVTYALPSGTQAKMFRSRDGGNTFTELGDTSICPNQCSYNLALAVNPTNSDDLFFGALDILRSVDGGANWSFPASTHNDQHALAFSATADRIYAGNDGGMWVSTSLSQVSWASINTNMSTL